MLTKEQIKELLDELEESFAYQNHDLPERSHSRDILNQRISNLAELRQQLLSSKLIEAAPQKKIVQIAGVGNELMALTEEGEVFYLIGGKVWSKLPFIP